jgi:uncharacterized protein YndB with AHSA1/START domain
MKKSLEADRSSPEADALDTIARLEALLGQTSPRKETPMAKAAPTPPTIVRMNRVFDAPRELVYRAWTDPKLMARWWGPFEFSVPLCRMDVRPGGELRIDMQGPDGSVAPMTGIFQEVVPNEKLVFTSYAFLGSPDKEPDLETVATVLFADQGTKTLLTWEEKVIRFKPEFIEGLMGMEEGMRQSLDKLVTFLSGSEPG